MRGGLVRVLVWSSLGASACGPAPYDDGFPAPGELPDCGPLTEPDPWFGVDDFQRKLVALGYVGFEPEPYPGVVRLTEAGFSVAVAETTLDVWWGEDAPAKPFADGEGVVVYAMYTEWAARGGLAIQSVGNGALVAEYQHPSMYRDAFQYAHALSCEYQQADWEGFVPPHPHPQQPDDGYARVFGRSATLAASGDALHFDRPGTATAVNATPLAGWVGENWIGRYTDEDQYVDLDAPSGLRLGVLRQP